MVEEVDLDYDLDVPATLTGDPVVNEARRRFDRCSEWEAIARQRFLEDLRFANGDADNGYQWPNAIRNSRDTQARPCLTMNLVNQHNKMISNQARKNKSTVKYVGMGNGATQESANVMRDIQRHVENQSQAQVAYTVARDFAISGGIGWWRITTDYVDNDSHDQEIYIRPINDPLSVYMDRDIELKSGHDAKFAFVFDDMPMEDFNEAYPKWKGRIGVQPLGMGTVSTDWVSKGKIRVCEYFRKVKKPDKSISMVHNGVRHTIRMRHLKKLVADSERRRQILDQPTTRIRDVDDVIVEWKLIAGTEVIDETEWPGKFIPLIRVIGEETVIEGVLDRKGHTRWMKDAQRMYNYNASAQVEYVALQTKAPWLAPVAAIEEHEEQWATQNVKNPSVLIYNHLDDEGQPIPTPNRIEPPNASPAYLAGMETASKQIMMTSGQFENQLGMMGNERTGKAINARQEQSDTAIYHFQDNYEDALISTGIQLIDLVPKIYDTKRVLHILSDDGVDYDLEIDPTLREGYLEHLRHDGEVAKRIFNPQIGRFDIAATVGPEYGSKRQETADALTLILTQAPDLVHIIGDLLLNSLDFDKASEAAARLRRMVPAMALGKGPTAQEQQLQAQVTALSAELAKSLHVQAKDQIKLVGKDELRDIEAYDAETKRMAALSKLLPTDPDGLRALVHQLVEQSMQTSLTNLAVENKPDETSGEAPAEPPPVSGAAKAPDGNWYIHDPTRPGKHLKIEPRV